MITCSNRDGDTATFCQIEFTGGVNESTDPHDCGAGLDETWSLMFGVTVFIGGMLAAFGWVQASVLWLCGMGLVGMVFSGSQRTSGGGNAIGHGTDLNSAHGGAVAPDAPCAPSNGGGHKGHGHTSER